MARLCTKESVSLLQNVQAVYGVRFSFYSMGNGVSYPRVERLVCEAGHSVPSRGNVKNEESYSSTPPYATIMQ